MNELAQVAIVAAISIPLIAISVLARAARQRAEQARDGDSDWLRAASSTFHHGGVPK